MTKIGVGLAAVVMTGALVGCQARMEDQARGTAAAENAERSAQRAEAAAGRCEQAAGRAEAAAQRAEAIVGKIEAGHRR